MDSVSICNLALGMLGIPAIASMEEPNNNAKLCKRFFPVLRDRVLRDHSWSFATASCAVQVLAEKSYDPEYEHVCLLPGDCIRVLRLIGGGRYRRLGHRIYVNEPEAVVEYIRRVENPEEFDETFTEALQYLLAAEIGMASTRDAQLISFYRKEYEQRLAIARSIDSQENRFAMQNSAKRSRWIESRGASGLCTGKIRWVEGTEGKQ